MTVAATHASLDSKAKLEGPEAWKGVCSSRCFAAKTERKRCKCKCRGEHHGRGLQQKLVAKGLDEFLRR